MGMHEKNKKQHVELPAGVAAKVVAEARDGRLACRRAFDLAKELDVNVLVIGAACDAAGIRVTGCQLGCF